MTFRILWLLLAASLAAPFAAAEVENETTEKPELAVLKVYNGAGSQWWDEIGADRAQRALTAQLETSQPSAVMARDDLSEALADRHVWLTGELSPAGAAKLGRQLRLRFLVSGTLVEFGTGARGSSKRSGRKLLGLGGPKDFRTELVLRLIDTSMGITIWSDSRQTQTPIRDLAAATDGSEQTVEGAIFDDVLLPMIEAMGAELATTVAEMPALEPPPED